MILFFDGVCGLCNGAVDFLLARDKHAKLTFAPLQGTTAFTRLPVTDTQDLNSLVLLEVNERGEKIYRKSDGVLKAAEQLGGGWKALAKLGQLIPRFLRDKVYDLVAANRYAVFGKRETCRLPTPDERTRFLD